MGKSSIITVFSLAVLLAIVLPNIHRMANASHTNYLGYVKSTQAHMVALSGVNVVLNRIFQTPSWRSGYKNVSFAGGRYSVEVVNYGPSGVKVTSHGSFADSTSTVSVILKPSSFSKYAYYSVVEGNIWWASKDTLYGPVHSQDQLQISGSPTFFGQVTTAKGTNPSKSAARFLGGYKAGVSVTMPSDLSLLQTAASNGGRVFSGTDLWVQLSGDSIRYKTSITGPETTRTISSITSNGVILVSNGNLHLQGVLKGRLTIAATGSNPSGSIYIEDDVRYGQDPRTNPKSTDMLGLVSENRVIIVDNIPNNSSCVVQASIFCRNGGLTAENYASRPISGTLDILGGLIQYQRGAVGTLGGGGGISHGYQKNYKYDERFKLTNPPYFPLTGKLEVVAWEE